VLDFDLLKINRREVISVKAAIHPISPELQQVRPQASSS
jgi:hypothetical protein